MIVSASASSCAATPILVWKWKHPASPERASVASCTITAVIDVIVRSLVLVAAMAHVYGIMKIHVSKLYAFHGYA